VTWLIKVIILRLGGISLYRRATPFFIGMIVGYTAALMVSMTIDLIWFPGGSPLVVSARSCGTYRIEARMGLHAKSSHNHFGQIRTRAS